MCSGGLTVSWPKAILQVLSLYTACGGEKYKTTEAKAVNDAMPLKAACACDGIPNYFKSFWAL